MLYIFNISAINLYNRLVKAYILFFCSMMRNCVCASGCCGTFYCNHHTMALIWFEKRRKNISQSWSKAKKQIFLWTATKASVSGTRWRRPWFYVKCSKPNKKFLDRTTSTKFYIFATNDYFMLLANNNLYFYLSVLDKLFLLIYWYKTIANTYLLLISSVFLPF